jgi:3-oxo-5-alpha-steroid 4-dehydrogenase 3 / polyprenol reductase
MSTIELIFILLRMDAIDVLRTSFLFSALAILIIYAIPALRDRFLVYGPRAPRGSTKGGPQENLQGWHGRLLNYVASIRVPHSWFRDFYMVSVVSSMVWLQQLYTRGPFLQKVVSASSLERPSMSFNQIVLCWTLLAIQGSRRLYECIALAKPSVSEMWIGHYLLGLVYYLAMGWAIWVEGSPALASTDEPLGDAAVSAPSISTFIFLPIFLLASGVQHDTHFYLNSLCKYSLPEHPAFGSIVSPHYTAECAVYLSLAFLAAPKGHLVNRTLLAAWTFVVVELGVSAAISKKWYMEKFGAHLVEHKWRMVPGVW